jgi:hypothetical protein
MITFPLVLVMKRSTDKPIAEEAVEEEQLVLEVGRVSGILGYPKRMPFVFPLAWPSEKSVGASNYQRR